jgi:hypothetical protein
MMNYERWLFLPKERAPFLSHQVSVLLMNLGGRLGEKEGEWESYILFPLLGPRFEILLEEWMSSLGTPMAFEGSWEDLTSLILKKEEHKRLPFYVEGARSSEERFLRGKLRSLHF